MTDLVSKLSNLTTSRVRFGLSACFGVWGAERLILLGGILLLLCTACGDEGSGDGQEQAASADSLSTLQPTTSEPVTAQNCARFEELVRKARNTLSAWEPFEEPFRQYVYHVLRIRQTDDPPGPDERFLPSETDPSVMGDPEDLEAVDEDTDSTEADLRGVPFPTFPSGLELLEMIFERPADTVMRYDMEANEEVPTAQFNWKYYTKDDSFEVSTRVLDLEPFFQHKTPKLIVVIETCHPAWDKPRIGAAMFAHLVGGWRIERKAFFLTSVGGRNCIPPSTDDIHIIKMGRNNVVIAVEAYDVLEDPESDEGIEQRLFYLFGVLENSFRRVLKQETARVRYPTRRLGSGMAEVSQIEFIRDFTKPYFDIRLHTRRLRVRDTCAFRTRETDMETLLRFNGERYEPVD